MKICIDCAHYTYRHRMMDVYSDLEHSCADYTDEITGERQPVACSNNRGRDGQCGPEGKHFQPKASPPS